MQTRKTIAIVCLAVLFVAVVYWSSGTRDNNCNTAYITLHGHIAAYIPDSESSSSTNALDQTSSDDVTRAIRNASKKSSIKAIILEVASPGGSPVGGQEIETALRDSKKPTVALIRNEGDSAAYLAATGADKIFASVFSDVGDIGITQSYTDNSKQDVSNGITFNQLSVGKYKDMFDLDKPMTDDEKSLAMGQLQIGYQNFVQIVANNRHMSVDTVTKLADGASMTGQQALEVGLIDKIGGIDDVRDYLQQKLGKSVNICGIDGQ